MADNIDLSSVSAATPPPGVVPDLASTYNEMEAVSIFTWTVCALLIIVCVALRCFTRFYIIKKIELADFLPFFACIGTVVYISLSITDLTLGAGKHAWNISASKAMQLAYMTNVIAAFYAVAIVLAKSSVIIPLMSTFTPNNKTWLYWSYVSLLSLHVGFHFSGMIAIIFACTPREKIWNPFLPGTCINQNAVYLLSSAWNIFTDFWIIVLPLFSIWHLRLAVRYKIGISIMFLTTIFALVASIVRMYYTIKLVTVEDATFVYAQLGLWTTAEMASLICCSCMPVFPRLYHWLRDHSTAKVARSGQVEFVRRGKQQDTTLSDKSFGTGTSTRVLVGTQAVKD